MNRAEIKSEMDSFLEFPADGNKQFVTTTSTLIFAEHVARMASKADETLLREVLRSIEEGESFDHFDAVIGPMLRNRLDGAR